MVVNNIVCSSQSSRIYRGNIVYTDGIRNIAHPRLCYGTGGCYVVESDTLTLTLAQFLYTIYYKLNTLLILLVFWDIETSSVLYIYIYIYIQSNEIHNVIALIKSLLVLRCQLYMFRNVTVHPQELLVDTVCADYGMW